MRGKAAGDAHAEDTVDSGSAPVGLSLQPRGIAAADQDLDPRPTEQTGLALHAGDQQDRHRP